MRILLTGDIVGKAGRRVMLERLIDVRTQHDLDLVIANVENAASGFSITPRIAEELFAVGVDVMTSGNHIFDKREILDYIQSEPRLLRPANYAPGVPGNGLWTGAIRGIQVAVLNLQGRVFMPPSDDPFRCADQQLATLNPEVKIILVDLHAEATAEKIALGRYLDGRVSVVVGTHTHVQTADEQILPGGTAYLTDLGMTGPHDGIIGMQLATVMPRFITGIAPRMEPSEGEIQMNGLIVEVDESSGKAVQVERFSLKHR